MNIVSVIHKTTYRYANPVGFGDHDLMLRPMAGRDLRVLESHLSVSPDARLSSRLDAYGNLVETARFDGTARELTVTSAFRVLHRARSPETLASISSTCARLPLDSGEARLVEDASHRLRRDPDRRLEDWADYVTGHSGDGAFDRFRGMCSRIHSGFDYARRDDMGTQDPLETLALGTGSCRDFAFLMVEAARSLGHAARFVSGYLYDEDSTHGEADALVGGMSTHAWAQVHLRGAGWVDFDPTNDLVGGRNLIPSSAVLEPSEACPVAGSYHGYRTDYLGMDVDVAVRSRPAEPRRFGSAPVEVLEDAVPAPRW